ncbi:hypothetical protein MNBD_BACTEROID03-903 [hydrothermal vent metagenome]|uniref:Uncharacterized protein n=1 Tax=hydrothermal vent metagenome TaxID=652676 RepID=A0A3B0TCV3_9ZZZZ
MASDATSAVTATGALGAALCQTVCFLSLRRAPPHGQYAFPSNKVRSSQGVLVVGRNHKRKNIVVKQDATFRVEGNLTIYGDLILKDGATIEFIGSSLVVNVFGRVNKSETAEVKGDLVEVRNRF